MRKLIHVTAAIALSLSFAEANTPIPRVDTSPKTKEARNLQSRFVEIRKADNPAEIEALKQEVIDLACEYLSRDASAESGEVLWFLHENTITVDLSTIDNCTSVPTGDDVGSQMFRSMLDESQLFFLGESEKREILRECLKKGKYELWRGTVLPINRCLGEAVWNGVPGLRADIEYAYAKKLGQSHRGRTSIDKMLAIHAIMKGPGTGWDQRDDAVREILAMGDTGLGLRLEKAEYFRSVILSLLQVYCSRGKKDTCDALGSGIESAVRSISTTEDGTPVEQINGWWRCALYEYGTFAPKPTPPGDSDQVTDEMIEAAMNRPFCESWSPNQYPGNDPDPRSD